MFKKYYVMHAGYRRQRQRLNSYVKICERTSVTHHFSVVAHYFSDLLLQLQQAILYIILMLRVHSTRARKSGPIILWTFAVCAREDLKLKIKRGKKRRSKRERERERVREKTWGKRKKSYVLYCINIAYLVYTMNKKRREKNYKNDRGGDWSDSNMLVYLVLPRQSDLGI